MPNKSTQSPPGAHVNFPELTWPPAQSDGLDMRAAAEPVAADKPAATPAKPPKRTFGSLIFLAVMAVCFLGWLAQAEIGTR